MHQCRIESAPEACADKTRLGRAAPAHHQWSPRERRRGVESDDRRSKTSRSALEGDLRAKLHFARVLRAEDASKIRRPENAVGQIEIRGVEHVEDLPTQLDLPVLGNRPRL